jgi:hypothetical protein
MHERVSPEEVNRHLNRAKVNVVWSRREGVNRAIIEGMFAGVPGILRQGFNFGWSYPFLNRQTGCFAREGELPEKLLWVIRNQDQFNPRQWVLEHMSCQKATQLLGEVIGEHARRAGKSWTGELAVKVSHLDAMQYWDVNDRRRFEPAYEPLRAAMRQVQSA